MGGRRKMLLVTGLALLLVALLSVPTAAECPNGCSGNGACMGKDMCNCYKNYQGNDCLDRTCQFGYAHADTPKGDIDMDQQRNTPSWILVGSQQDPEGTYEYFNPYAGDNEAHFYMECSNKGLCDRSLGTCTCFDGYEGVACQRAACPNKCNGHGTCESIRELGLQAPGTLFGIPGNAATINYDLWDSRVTYGCRCDPWYHGADCSLRSCKVGVDPMFLSVGSATYETFVLHAWINVVPSGWDPNAATGPPANYVRLRLFDYHGESYITDAIPIITDKDADAAASLKAAKANADAVATAIKKIPNQTFRDVLCEPIGGVNKGADLAGYTSSRLAASDGLSVVCQFTENPGRLREPEIAAVDFKNVVNPALKKAVIYTKENGMDNEWFTVDSSLIVSRDATTEALTLPGTTTRPMGLFKLGPHVVAASVTTGAITFAYPLQHTLPTTTPLFDAIMDDGHDNGGMVVAALTLSPPVTRDSTTITVSDVAKPVFADGDLIFLENQFYKPQAVTGATTAWIITLDRPFAGISNDGGNNLAAITAVFKVTPPKPELQYNYVSPCSGRGLCGTETGVCACFKGYTNDNCDTQNILAL